MCDKQTNINITLRFKAKWIVLINFSICFGLKQLSARTLEGPSCMVNRCLLSHYTHSHTLKCQAFTVTTKIVDHTALTFSPHIYKKKHFLFVTQNLLVMFIEEILRWVEQGHQILSGRLTVVITKFLFDVYHRWSQCTASPATPNTHTQRWPHVSLEY